MTMSNAAPLPVLGQTRTLWNASIRGASIDEIIRAALAGGFNEVSVLAQTLRRAEEEGGPSPEEMRQKLDDAGLTVTGVEGPTEWLGGNELSLPVDIRHGYAMETLVGLVARLGARMLVSSPLKPRSPVDIDAAVPAFAGLCRLAADVGIAIALEPACFLGITDLSDALRIVESSGAANAGVLLDSWHLLRCSPNPSIPEAATSRVLAVQLSDGRQGPATSLAEHIALRRLPNGDGEYDIVTFITDLVRKGVNVPIGVEVIVPGYPATSPEDSGRLLAASLDGILSEAGSPSRLN